MASSAAPRANWPRLSEFIAEKMGLHFPPERWTELRNSLAGATAEFGLPDVDACVDWLLTAPLTKAQLQVLASHLTIGETYFFREKKTFDVFGEKLLPELVRSRRGREQRLRFWSSACCTGEEPYSLAILLHQVIPDLQDWHVTILATDINERFLQKAAAGVYGQWSFRQTPAWFKERYFQCAGDGRYAILPQFKKLVTFAHLNLVEDVYPSLATDTNAMDVIFCRNVLMYFTMPQAQKVLRNLHRALLDGGWLAVSPSEGSQALFPGLTVVNFPGAILFQKGEAEEQPGQLWASPTCVDQPNVCEPVDFRSPAIQSADLSLREDAESPRTMPLEESVCPEAPPTPTPIERARSLYQEGRYAEATEALLNSPATSDAPCPQMFSLLARALANQGKLSDALTWCERWISGDKLDCSGHYLRAVVSQELGDHEAARCSLQRAIYLQPGFVLAHFALGNLARTSGKTSEAEKHFANALDLLRSCPLDGPLPESDGLTAGRLMEIIASLIPLMDAP